MAQTFDTFVHAATWGERLVEAKQAVTKWKHRQSNSREAMWTSLTDVVATDYGPIRWLVEGVVQEKSLVVVAADPKAAKTFFLLELAIALASGTKAFDTYPTSPGHALLFLNEDDARSVKNRSSAFIAKREDRSPECFSRVGVRIRQHLDLADWESVEGLIASVFAAPERPAFIALDPLRNLHGKDENKSDEMGAVMMALRCIRDICDCAVVFAHHNNKPAGRDESRSPAHRMRGSSAIHGACDAIINLVDTEKGPNWISNKCVVELKNARGAGLFKLVLTMEDNENREVVHAKWDVEDVEPAQKGKREERRFMRPQEELDFERCVLDTLTHSNRACRTAGQAVVWLSKGSLYQSARDKLPDGISKLLCFTAIDGLVERGKLAMRTRGQAQIYNVPSEALGVISGGKDSNE